MGSGQINTEKMLERHDQSGHYNIPVHEFVRSIIFGDTKYYDPSSSPVANLMRLTRQHGAEHFLVPTMLAFIQIAGDSDTQYGYVSANAIYSSMQDLGYESSEISAALDFCARYNLLDSTRRFGRVEQAEVFRATTIGAYTYKTLLPTFAYIDAIATDLQVLDSEYRNRVSDAHSIANRLARAITVLDYLDDQWARTPDPKIWDWTAVSSAARADIARIQHFN